MHERGRDLFSSQADPNQEPSTIMNEEDMEEDEEEGAIQEDRP